MVSKMSKEALFEGLYKKAKTKLPFSKSLALKESGLVQRESSRDNSNRTNWGKASLSELSVSSGSPKKHYLSVNWFDF